MTGYIEIEGLRLPVLETLEDWALFWASQDIPVFPLHEVYSGVCTCTCTKKRCRGDKHGCGEFCESRGKHPRWNRDDLPNGVENASVDFELIRRWWRRWPDANIGGAMGGFSQLVALDFDPKNGGDLSLSDLQDAHGSAWLDTLTFKTGSGGFHFVYQYPGDHVLYNSAQVVAPGVDTRGQGGYIVLPPSIHASGNRYQMHKVVEVKPAPLWLLEAFREDSPKDSSTRPVIDFQAYRECRSSLGGSVIVEGERNDRLFRIGCAVWGKGEVLGRADLFQKMMEANHARVLPPLDSEEVWKLADNIAGRYPRGVPIQEGAA